MRQIKLLIHKAAFSRKQRYHLIYGTPSVVEVIHCQNRSGVFGEPCTITRFTQLDFFYYTAVKDS